MKHSGDYSPLKTDALSVAPLGFRGLSTPSWKRILVLVLGLVLLMLLMIGYQLLVPKPAKLPSIHETTDEEHLLNSIIDGAKDVDTLRKTETAWTQLERVASKPLGLDLRMTTLKLRLYKKLTLQSMSRDGTWKAKKILKFLKSRLFDWHNEPENIEHRILSTSKGRGIVIPTGQKYFSMAVHLIRCIRLLECTLPIEVFYAGTQDLDKPAIDFLSSMYNVSAVDISNIYNNDILKLSGWDIKPFAMLASSFQEVILMDADTVFLQSPEVLFKTRGYRDTGALFFVDRFFRSGAGDYAQWFSNIFPEPLGVGIQNSHMYRDESNYEQESGVVVIDKKRRLAGLLATCRLNCPVEREFIHSKTHGDKETFWFGFEMTQEPYVFLDKLAGSIGVSTRMAHTGQTILCGHLAHFDEQGRLLWFNDGIVEEKSRRILVPGDFQHTANTGNWLGLCLNSPNVREIPPDQIKLLEKMKILWQSNPVGMPLNDFGERTGPHSNETGVVVQE